MSTGLITAGSGQGWENELVAALDRPGSPLTVIRRCVDIAEVLAEASTGMVSVVAVSADLRRLDTEAVGRLQAVGIAVLAVHRAGDQRAPVRLGRIGITHLIADDAGAAAVAAAARAALRERSTDAGPPAGPVGPDLAAADTRRALPEPGPADPFVVGGSADPGDPAGADSAALGRVVAVWGPTGAPGRTTVAAGVAAAAAASGVPTLLVDGDVYGGVLASAFGLLDESPGLAGACRLAANGRLDRGELTSLVWAVGPHLRLLTGITRPDRWPELRPSAVPGVLAVARTMAALTVVDCGFALEADEEITFDTLAPRRNGATLALLAAADGVLAVGSADPPGMERLIRGLAELSDAVPDARPRVVVNRCRRTAASAAEAADAVRRFAGLEVTATLPEDRPATDRAWAAGQPLVLQAPASPLVRALGELTGRLLPQLRVAA